MRYGLGPGKRYGGYVLPVVTNGKPEYKTGQLKKANAQLVAASTIKNVLNITARLISSYDHQNGWNGFLQIHFS